MRVFLAVDLNEEMRGAAALAAEKLSRKIRSGVRWVEPKNLHITIQFFGETPGENLPSLCAAVRRAAKTVEPFRMSLSGVGAFPGVHRPRVIWIGAEAESNALINLAEVVRREALASGFEIEEREFLAHITLGRVKERLSEDLESALAAVKIDSASGAIEKIVLYESRPGSGGSVYTPIDEFRLGGD